MARVLECNWPHGFLTEGEPSPSADPVAPSTDVLTDSGRAISMRARYTNGLFDRVGRSTGRWSDREELFLALEIGTETILVPS